MASMRAPTPNEPQDARQVAALVRSLAARSITGLGGLLYGDTPRPITTSRPVEGTTDLHLVVVHNRQTGERFASLHRALRGNRAGEFERLDV
jgi:hypothetical protein